MTKDLRKAIMKRSEPETKFYRTKYPKDQTAYKKQRTFLSRLYKRERKKYYSNLDVREISDNKKVWDTMKPFFSDKNSSRQITNIMTNEKIITEDVEIGQNMNNFFSNSVKSLGIQENQYLLTGTST